MRLITKIDIFFELQVKILQNGFLKLFFCAKCKNQQIETQ